MIAYKTTPAYHEVQEFAATLGGENIRFISKPGLPDWDAITPAALLLVERIKIQADNRLLLLGSGNGALAARLAQNIPDGELWSTDISFLAVQMTGLTLQANHVEKNSQSYVDINFTLTRRGTFDVAVILLPKGRKLAQRWLLEAYIALRPGGRLYLAGSNHQGIQSSIKDAASLFGKGTILGYKKGNRAAWFVKGLINPGESLQNPDIPDWVNEPGIRPGTWQEFDVTVGEETLHIHSLPGVFSSDRLDEGTRLLLSVLNVNPGEKILDLGCGCGIIGLAAARKGDCLVDMVDTNLMAVASAKQNVSTLRLTNARVLPSDVINAILDQKYDQVLTNPPFHSDRSVNYETAQAFIAQAYQVLKPGGCLILVANKFIRYDRTMRQRFGNVRQLAGTNRYYVLMARKPVSQGPG